MPPIRHILHCELQETPTKIFAMLLTWTRRQVKLAVRVVYVFSPQAAASFLAINCNIEVSDATSFC